MTGARLTGPMKALLPVLEAMRLAPSGHNTQPWLLTPLGERGLRIGWDAARWPSAADPAGEVLACSLGCAIEAAASVAALAHEACPVVPRGSPAAHAGEIHVERLAVDPEPRLALLGARRTQRAPFERRALESPLLARLMRAGRVHGCEIGIVADRSQLSRLARLTARGAHACLSDAAYLEELLGWIRLAPPFDDGFHPAALGLDPVTRRIVAWLQRDARLRRAAPRLGLARVQAWQAAHALSHSGAAVVILTDQDCWPGWVRAGRAAMSLWLEATRCGVAVQPVHFPLLLDETRDEVMRILGAGRQQRAVSLLRLGWATSPAPASGRLALERILAPDPAWSAP